MVYCWIKLVGVLLILNKMTSLVQCYCDESIPYFPVYYPEEGTDFILDVLLNHYKNFTWKKDGKELTLKACSKEQISNCRKSEHIYLHQGRADLHFVVITLEDSGKYVLELNCHDGRRRVNSFKLLVEDKPHLLIDCNDMTVYEGENITCVCKTTVQHHAATGRWLRSKQMNKRMKHLTDILTLKSVSSRESGTYTCVPNSSSSFANKTSFFLTVIPRISRIEIKYFKIFREARINSGKLVLLCEAQGVLQYTISHNGTVVQNGNMYIVDNKNVSNLGQYECLAKNGAGSDKRLMFLNKSFLDKSCLGDEKWSPWKIRLIVGASSFLTGIFVLYVLICCCKECKKEDDDVRRRKTETLASAREKQEMRLRCTSSKRVEERQSAGYEDVEQRQSVEYENMEQQEQETMAPGKINCEMKLRYPLSRSVESHQSTEYEDVEQREQETIMALANVIHDMKLRCPLSRSVEERRSAKYEDMHPLSRSEEQLSAEYDEPEAGNNDDHVYYNQSSFSRI